METGACSCDDYTYRADGDDGGASTVTGRRGLPEWANIDALDPLLKERLGLETDR